MPNDFAETSVSPGPSGRHPAEQAQPPNNALIASDSRGRLRIRLHRTSRHPEIMRRIAERFRALNGNANGIFNVETNAETGSVVINYNAEQCQRDDIMSMLGDAGIIIRDVAKGLGEDVPEFGRSHSSEHLITAFNHLDRRLSLATGHRVDLKLAFPLVLGSLGAWRLIGNGLGLSEIPAYVLLWYAFDSFFKLNMATAQNAPSHEEYARQPDITSSLA